MIKRTVLLSLLALLMLCGMSAEPLSKATSELQEAFSRIEDTSEMIFIYAVMTEQYDTDYLYNQVQDLSRPERREFTISRLTEHSNETQENLRTLIEHLEEENLVTRTSFLWITNIIGMKATAEAIKIIDKHPDIEIIEYDPMVKMVDDAIDSTLDKEKDSNESNSQSRNTRNDDARSIPDLTSRNITYNVSRVNAPQVWDQGYEGQGVLVAVLDTGVNYNHRDLQNQMWIHPDYPNHGYNFVNNNLETMDMHSHGTHCAGTVAANGLSGTRCGVAPRTTIMALKTLSDEGSGNVQFSLAAFQFSVQHGVDVMSCSFGAMGANPVGRRTRRDALNNVLSAGVIAAVSAGNSGNEQDEHPIPGNIGAPSDCPPPWLHPDQTLLGGRSAVVSVGATDSNDRIANFSSRGPTTWSNVIPFNDYAYNPGMGLIKPDVVAPGVNIRSTTHSNNTGYFNQSGTSMSAPAVAGVMSLMLSKDPNLTPEKLTQILEETAYPLSPTKDNTFGSGIVNALEALKRIKYIEVDDFIVTGGLDIIPQYGETVSITMTLRNNSDAEALNVQGTISSDDEYVTIVDDSANFGNIDSEDTSTANNAFTIRIADNIPHAHQIDFSIHINPGNDQYNWYDDFSFEVNAPHLTTLTPRVHDPEPGGNNNGLIEPGEEVTLYLPIANVGGVPTVPVSIQLHSVSDFATITHTSETYFSFINDGERAYPAIELSVSEDTPEGTILPFNYSFQTGNYNFSGRFSTIVGESITAQLGTGDAFSEGSSPSPINIYFKTLRSQTVYTVEEFNAVGASGTIPLTQLGFYVQVPPAHELPNFVIRMKHTQATDGTEHIDGPYTTVFGPVNYSPIGGDWNMLQLSTPFMWNGVDNILVDTAFSPARDWDASGQVRIYNYPNGFRYGRHDSTDQTNVPTSDVNNNKPQIKVFFELAEGSDPYSPRNLASTLQDEEVHLTWEVPAENRDGSQNRSSRNSYNNRLEADIYRNPQGYNIYRNGVKINSTLITNTFYIDSDLQPSASYYYYATSVYPGFESAPSMISSIRGIAPPQYDPPAGVRSNPFFLTINSMTPDTEIFYTLNGEEPSHNSTLYETPIEITDNIQVRAIAYREGYLPSLITSADYLFLNQPRNVNINATTNFALVSWSSPSGERNDSTDNERRRMSSEGRVVSNISQRALRGYNIYRADNSDNLVKINTFLIIDNEYFDADLEPGVYKYGISAVYEEGESEMTDPVTAYVGIVAPPVFTPESGAYDPPFEVTITSATENAIIRFTTDNSTPNTSSPVYSGEPLIVEQDIIIKAIGIKSGWQTSAVSTAAYTTDTTDIEDELSTPLITELHNAYPNPFNPETTIRFSLKELGNVKLEIYNIAGQLVKTLVDEQLDRGVHHIKWQGTNNKGSRTGSGIYFYRLTTSDYQEVKKVVLLK